MSRFEFKMPKLGESITDAAIITWFKNVGDAIEQDEMFLEVATDKVDSEVPSTVSGVVEEIFYKANDVIKIGDVIAIIKTDDKADAINNKSRPKSSSRKPKPKKEPKTKLPKALVRAGSNNNTFFSPLIISIANKHYISFDELARIPASGDEGRLRKSDLFQYIKAGRPYKFTSSRSTQDPTVFRIPQLNLDKGKGEIVKMDRMRKMIADHMVYSKHTSPHVTAYVDADLTNLVEWRNINKGAFQKKYDQKLTFTPLFVEAVAKAVNDFPMINVSIDGDEIIVKKEINVGMATALPSGNLIVPVVKNANFKNLKELTLDINALVEKARTNKLEADDIKGSTFTISNVGTFGSVMGTPIINQPEVAILALGIIKKRAEVMETEKGDEIAIRSMMYLSLSFDHRVVDGYLGGSFLRRIADYLEQFDLKRKI